MLLVAPALAASLDNIQIAGPWGTPGATDATATWWNPAGLAQGKGTRLMLEAEPTWATVTYSRSGKVNPGDDVYTLSGVVPFAGAASDLGVDGLGLGLALAIPFVRGGAEVNEPGPGRYAMREGDSRAMFIILAGGYDFLDKFAIGGGVALVQTEWVARVDTDTMPDLQHALEEEDPEHAPDYTDDQLEDPNYSATLHFSPLHDTAFTFNVGARATPLDNLAISVAYVHSTVVNNEGTVDIVFNCPTDTEDTVGSFGADSLGLCNATVPANASVGYTLPKRIHGGIVWWPVPTVRLEAMGGWVGWSEYSDFTIKVYDAEVNPEKARAADGEEMVNSERLWARANVDSGWVALDAKGFVGWRWTVGGRVLYDKAAVPDEALSTNNWDADSVSLSALVAFKPVRALEIGVSLQHDFYAERTVTQSGFYQTVDEEPPEDRWNYPHGNGTYTGSLSRIGVALRSEFGGKKR